MLVTGCNKPVITEMKIPKTVSDTNLTCEIEKVLLVVVMNSKYLRSSTDLTYEI
jgi:hypothetical protein